MKRNKIALKYARALMGTALKVDAVNEVSKSLRILSDLISKDAMFKVFFQSRRITPKEKKTILINILGENCHSLVLEIFMVLAIKKEYRLLAPIADIYENLRIKEMNILPASLITAEKLDESEFQKIQDSLENITGKILELEPWYDPEIIGGIKLKTGNILVDNSIRGMMEKIKQQLIRN